MPELVIPKKLYDDMISHCRSVYPYEACGLLAGKGRAIERIYQMTNIEQSGVSYMMDPGEQFSAMKEMRADSTHIVAIYHSHTHSHAYPSQKDVDLAFYADSVYIIVSLVNLDSPEVRGFRITERDVREIGIGLGQ